MAMVCFSVIVEREPPRGGGLSPTIELTIAGTCEVVNAEREPDLDPVPWPHPALPGLTWGCS
jgi:hypothetical protein